MRHGQLAQFIYSSAQDAYPRGLAAIWLCRLLDRRMPITDDMLIVADWCEPGLDSLIKKLLPQCATMPMNLHQKATLELLQDEEQTLLKCEEYLSIAPLPARSLIRKNLREALARVTVRPSKGFRQARKLLTQFFLLPELACDICDFLFCVQHVAIIENYFEDNLNVTTNKNEALLALMLGCSVGQLRNTLQNLKNMGIVDTEHHIVFSQNLGELWLTPKGQTLDRLFFSPLPRDIYPLAEFAINEEDRNHLQKLLRMPSKRPVHILLYGEPGTGKSCFVASLAAHLGIKVWASPPNERGEAEHRRASIQACSVMAHSSRAQGQCSLVLVDEADSMLDVTQCFTGTKQDKAWLNTYLEQPNECTIWIANDVSGLDESIARRFAFSAHFPALGMKERSVKWQRILHKARMDTKVDAAQVQALAKDFSVSMGVMAHSVERCKKLYGRSPKQFLAGVRQSCTAFETLCGNGSTKQKKNVSKVPHYYNPAAACLDKSVLSVDSLLTRMIAADATLRRGNSLGEGACTVLFYGPPGTGKTALARHLAQELERECHVVQASDWLDKYVGGTEQNIARSFRDAEAQEAVLVIEEADSFAFSRKEAQRSWENSMVNEFLTNLENFKGFCICTTNRQKELDKAALRRFTFKVPFTWASEDIALLLYKEVLAPLVCASTGVKIQSSSIPTDIDKALRKLAKQCPGLSPGDFHAVRAAFSFAPQAERTHARLLDALRHEMAHKKENNAACIGF